MEQTEWQEHPDPPKRAGLLEVRHQQRCTSSGPRVQPCREPGRQRASCAAGMSYRRQHELMFWHTRVYTHKATFTGTEAWAYVYRQTCTCRYADTHTYVCRHSLLRGSRTSWKSSLSGVWRGRAQNEPRVTSPAPLNHMPKRNISNKGTKWHLVVADPSLGGQSASSGRPNTSA